jgi:hypothetical protein
VVGPRGLQAADDLAAPRRPLRVLEPRPELGEAPGGVRDQKLRGDDPGVGVPYWGTAMKICNSCSHAERTYESHYR